jgi:hypothetical protein
MKIILSDTAEIIMPVSREGKEVMETSIYFHPKPMGDWLRELLDSRITSSAIEVRVASELAVDYSFEASNEEIEVIRAIILSADVPTLFKRQVLAKFPV